MLKFIALTLLCICLLDPQLKTQKPVKGATSFIILSDNSQSMKTTQPGDEQSKADQLLKIYQQGTQSWQRDLKENFELHHFAFDQRLKEIDNEANLEFKGDASRVIHHLNELSSRFSKEKNGGILLLTDGIVTDADLELDVKNLPPIYPVIIQDKNLRKDIWIEDMNSTVSAFEDAPVDINIEVHNQGYTGQALTLDLLNRQGEIIESQSWTADEKAKVLRFQPKDSVGMNFYEAKVYATKELSQFESGTALTEISLLNNRRHIKIDRRGGPYRVLYVSGRVNWEYKFLARALESDPQIQMRALIRIAKKEEKFNFRPGRNNNVNPLFQALDENKAQQGENYDEPVFMRINTSDEKELESGFPNKREDLYSYHALIIDDCEAGFFTQDQLAMLREYVSERGGALLMLGGMESLQEGLYEKTPLKDLLPVYLTGFTKSDQAVEDESYRLELSREGWLQPWVRLYDNELNEKKRFNSMVDFQVLNRLKNIKPGAQVLATVKNKRDESFPALVFQKYGLGKSAVFAIGDFWRWGMQGPEEKENLSKSWRQMLRWLTADTPRFMELKISESQDRFQPVAVSFYPRDKEFKLLNNLQPTLKITDHLGQVTDKAMQPDPKTPGLYTCEVYPDAQGIFQAQVDLQDEKLPEGGRQLNAFNHAPEMKELSEFQPNIELLSRVASQSGGKLLNAADLGSFVRNIPQESFKVLEEKSEPLWNKALVFLLIISLLSAEWWLRRSKGMP